MYFISLCSLLWIKNLLWWRTWGVWIAKDLIHKNLELHIPVRMQPNKSIGDSENIDGRPMAIHSLQLRRGLMLLYSTWRLFPVMVLENERFPCYHFSTYNKYVCYIFVFCLFVPCTVVLATLHCVKLLVLRNMQPPVIPNIAITHFAKSILSCFDCICYASLHPPW